MKKILVLCDHGMIRSVAMASVLREAGHFAVAGSYDNYEKIARNPLYTTDCTDSFYDTDVYCDDIFDKIIFMQEGGEHFIGRDEWYGCTHPELIEKCKAKARELGLIE